MPEYPDIRRGTRFDDTVARQWQNLTRDGKAVAGMQVGEGLELNRAGEVMHLGLSPEITRRRPETRIVVLVPPFDSDSMVLTVREVQYWDTPPSGPEGIQYAWHDVAFEAFPEPGATPSDYESFVWFEGQPQITTTTFLRARYKHDLWTVELPGEAGEGSTVSRVLLAMEAGLTDDHLVCRAVGSDPIDYTPILVAKPWLLRKTPWNGQTRDQVRYVYDLEDSTKRTAYDINDPPNERTEMISPQYLSIPGDELIVASVATGVEVDTGEVDEDGEPILTPVNLIDMTGPRAWAVALEML